MILFKFSKNIEISSFLEKIGKEKYTDILIENGFNTLRSIGNFNNQDYGFTRNKLMEIIKDGKEVSIILDLAGKEISKNQTRNFIVWIFLFIVIPILVSLFFN